MTTMADRQDTSKIPRSLQCRAYRCGAAADLGGLCRAHRRGLALTAAISDAVLHFLNDAPGLAKGDVDGAVGQAGEDLARAIAQLVGTQFNAEMMWNCAPLTFMRNRWRIRFSWAAIDDFEYCGPIDFADFEKYADDKIDDEGSDEDE